MSQKKFFEGGINQGFTKNINNKLLMQRLNIYTCIKKYIIFIIFIEVFHISLKNSEQDFYLIIFYFV